MVDQANGAKAGPAQEATMDPEVAARIVALRSQVRETFGQVVMALMALPRYRHLAIADLQHLALEPLIRDRIAIAQPAKTEPNQISDIAGFAIWASVSEEVDAKMKEQVKAGVWPLRLREDEWNSGEINWLIDLVASNEKIATSVLANFKQVVKEGELRLHPIVGRLVNKDALDKMRPAP